jgi:hypothetical protein
MSDFAKWRNVLRDTLVDVQDARVRQQAMDALDKLDDQHMLTEGRVDNYEHLLVGALAALEVLLRQAPPPLGFGKSEAEIEEELLGPELYKYWQDLRRRTDRRGARLSD